jgi:hypothetical protein
MDRVPFELLCVITRLVAAAGYTEFCAPLSCASSTMRRATLSVRGSYTLVLRPELAQCPVYTARKIAAMRPAHVAFYSAHALLRALELVPLDALASIETAWYTRRRVQAAPVDVSNSVLARVAALGSTDLAVPSCCATDADVDALVAGRDVRRLCVSRNLAVTLVPSCVATLVELRIASTSVRDLGPLRAARNLRVLDASRTRVRDLGPVEDLMAAGSLRSVNLAFAPITSIGRVCATTIVDPRILDLAFSALRGILASITDPVCEITSAGWAVWSSHDPLGSFVSVEVID